MPLTYYAGLKLKNIYMQLEQISLVEEICQNIEFTLMLTVS